MSVVLAKTSLTKERIMAVATQPKNKLMRFRILAGQHRMGHIEIRDNDGNVTREDTTRLYAAKIVMVVKDDEGNEYEEMKPPKGFEEGCDIIDTTVDLAKRFNAGIKPEYRKFERLPDPEQPGEVEADEDAEELNVMNVKGLREFAENNEIDLGTATRKQEIINTILAARAEA